MQRPVDAARPPVLAQLVGRHQHGRQGQPPVTASTGRIARHMQAPGIGQSQQQQMALGLVFRQVQRQIVADGHQLRTEIQPAPSCRLAGRGLACGCILNGHRAVCARRRGLGVFVGLLRLPFVREVVRIGLLGADRAAATVRAQVRVAHRDWPPGRQQRMRGRDLQRHHVLG